MANRVGALALGEGGLATGEVTRRLGGGLYLVALGERTIPARAGGQASIPLGAAVVVARTDTGNFIMTSDAAHGRQEREVVVDG